MIRSTFSCWFLALLMTTSFLGGCDDGSGDDSDKDGSTGEDGDKDGSTGESGDMDGGSDEEPAAELTTFNQDVRPILQAKCAPCHTGSIAGGGSGGHNGGSLYADAIKDNRGNSLCSGTTTVAACMLKRIKDGSMPRGAGCSGDPSTDSSNDKCLTQAEQDLFQDWLDDSTPEGDPL